MKYSIFCDESGTVKERYMVLGGIILPHKNVRHVEAKIKSIKELEYFDKHEIKFSKLNNRKKLYFYQRILNEVYFDISSSIDFRCIIFDTKQISHKDYDNSFDDNIHSNVRGFYKQYYQLLNHQFCKVNSEEIFEGIFYITLDARSDPACVYDELYMYLSQKIGSQRIRPIQSINSEKSGLLQLVDLLVGSVSCEVNSRDKKEKLELINFIKTKKNLITLSEQSYTDSFRVWRFDYNKSTKSKGSRLRFDEL